MQLSISDVAGLLGVTEKTIYRWIGKGKLPAYRIGQQYRFNRAELLEWANAHRVAVVPDAITEPAPDEPLPSLTEALRAGGINYRIGGRTKRDVLQSVVDTIRLPDQVDREVLLAVLLARETMGSTGVGDGIAIPHVRNPIVLQLSRATVSLCFLEEAIDFGAIDGKPVDTLFVVTSPSVRAHLHLLSHLAYALRDDSMRALLRHQPGREAIYEAFERHEATVIPPPQMTR